MKDNATGVLILCLLATQGCAPETDPTMSANEHNPSPHKAATVVEGDARFTFLTDRLVRME